MLVFIIILVVSSALIIGAVWGAYGKFPDWLQGNLLALAGGALMLAVSLEMLQPAVHNSGLWKAALFTMLGAMVFTGVDYIIDTRMKDKGGMGLLAAVTLDGIPENLALGVSLISGNVMHAAALAGSILLSNLPEAAGGAKQMIQSNDDNSDKGTDKSSRKKAVLIWAGAAVILSLAALVGNLLLRDVPKPTLSLIDSFAAGAVIASLATEIFPEAFEKSNHWSGISAAIGLILALGLNQLGG